MADKRSEITKVKTEDLEQVYASLNRKLARLRVLLDDAKAAGKKSVSMQYFKSGEVAASKLDAFNRGVDESLG